MAPIQNRECQIAQLLGATGLPDENTFKLVSYDLPPLQNGEVLVRNIWMSVVSAMRGTLIDSPGYFRTKAEIGQTLPGGAIGQVIESKSANMAVGTYVMGSRGWRDYDIGAPEKLTVLDPTQGPIQAHLGVLGATGFPGYFGLLHLAGGIKPGETVVISTAAGAVGSAASQIAKLKGARVIGISGDDKKCQWLRDVAGLDATINYKKEANLSAAFKAAAPEGIDIYFENVGGNHFNAALDNMKMHGRIIVCGMIDRYNAERPMPAPHNIVQVLYKRLLIHGFIQSDHNEHLPQFRADMAEWLKAGKIKYEETVYDGLESAPEAFTGMFTGANIGKMLVKLGPDPAV